MSNRAKLTILAAALATVLSTSGAAVAQASSGSGKGGAPDAMMHGDGMKGMMNMMMQGGAATQGDTMQGMMNMMMQMNQMMGMMNMMMQMSQMMETCNKMMDASMRSPDQPGKVPGEPMPAPDNNKGG